ncbi:NAD(P)H-quinone oxidoreductase subunit N [Leptodesmis sp.]|uniref:NAD(P)H-quinone oxidoreductase subunit N n=1 Tax=Leptodesmis sp. TaxID=3100501 RepID=UPI00405353FD
MALITTGKKLIQDLETHRALGAYVPLEGGFEGRYRRRIRAAGYESLSLSARGLGDLSSYLMGIHGVRPPHLGKKSTGAGAAVGYRYFIPPIVSYNLENLSPQHRGLLLWILEGNILTNEEIEYLTRLPEIEPRVKVVLELGGDRYFRWMPLKQASLSA